MYSTTCNIKHDLLIQGAGPPPRTGAPHHFHQSINVKAFPSPWRLGNSCPTSPPHVIFMKYVTVIYFIHLFVRSFSSTYFHAQVLEERLLLMGVLEGRLLPFSVSLQPCIWGCWLICHFGRASDSGVFIFGGVLFCSFPLFFLLVFFESQSFKFIDFFFVLFFFLS